MYNLTHLEKIIINHCYNLDIEYVPENELQNIKLNKLETLVLRQNSCGNYEEIMMRIDEIAPNLKTLELIILPYIITADTLKIGNLKKL